MVFENGVKNIQAAAYNGAHTSRLDAHVGFVRLLMKGIFGPYVL